MIATRIARSAISPANCMLWEDLKANSLLNLFGDGVGSSELEHFTRKFAVFDC
jgi:hypothetical protein